MIVKSCVVEVDGHQDFEGVHLAPIETTPSSPLSVALIVFVLTPNGRVDTIGGQQLTANRVARVQPGESTAETIRRQMREALPDGTITSRIRPLMPRNHNGMVVLPVWATGRLPEGFLRGAAAPGIQAGALELGVLQLGALERLAQALGDRSLRSEAHAEFRRALAADPVSHQLLGERARLRALAEDESEREPVEDEIPPIFGLLPTRFSLDELHAAVNQAARLPVGEEERSTNFRRRLTDLTDAGVLRETGEKLSADQPGRPAMLYHFDHHGWRRWLERQGGRGSVASFQSFESRVGNGSPRSKRSIPESHLELPLRGEAAKPTNAREASDARVERLESMMQGLMDEIAELRKARRERDS